MFLVGGDVGQVPLVGFQRAGALACRAENIWRASSWISGCASGCQRTPKKLSNEVADTSTEMEVNHSRGRLAHCLCRPRAASSATPSMQASAMRSQAALALAACSPESLAPACMPGILAPHQRGYSRSRADRRLEDGARAAGVSREQAVGHEFRVNPAGVFQGQRREPDALRRDAVGDDLGGDAHGESIQY